MRRDWVRLMVDGTWPFANRESFYLTFVGLLSLSLALHCSHSRSSVCRYLFQRLVKDGQWWILPVALSLEIDSFMSIEPHRKHNALQGHCTSTCKF